MVDTHPVSSGAGPLRWDPLVVLDDPYPTYRRLRDEAPLYHDDERDFWAFTRYDDVQSAARDWATYSSGDAAGNDLDNGAELFQPAGDLAGIDPPSHDRIRAVLHPAFRPSVVKARFEPVVREAVIRLIDRFADRDSADFARELARPLPAEMVCSWLGFPIEDHAYLTEPVRGDAHPRPRPAGVARQRPGRPRRHARVHPDRGRGTTDRTAR